MLAVVVFLCVMWAVGILTGAIILLKSGVEDFTRLGAAVMGCIGIPIAVLIAAMPMVYVMDQQSPDLAVLKKNEWMCSETRTETIMMPVVSGNTTTMVPSVQSVCIQYSRTN